MADPTGWKKLTPAEAVAEGLLPPGPLAPAVKSTSPAENAQAIRAVINPDLPALEAEFKQAAGMTPQGRIPTASLLGAGVSPLVGLLVPPGRTVSRVGGQLLGNIVGHAGAEAAGEMVDKPSGERNVSDALMAGGLKGILPGLVQGAVGAMGPSKATIQVQKAIQSVKRAVSPEVGAHLDPTKPASFFSRATPKAMDRAAGANLDAVEAAISKRLKDRKFTEELTLPGGKKLTSEPTTTFEQLRAQIKDLRKNAGPLAYAQDPVTQKTARESLAKAAWMEQNMLKQMPPEIAQAYQQAMRQHAKDMDAVRFVKGQQQRQKISGGVNPFDRPELGNAEQQLKLPSLGAAAAHGAVGTVGLLTGHGLGAAYHLGRAAENVKSGKFAGKVAEKSPLRPRGLPGMAAGTAASAAQDYALRSTGE